MNLEKDSIEHNRKGESTQENLRPSLVQDPETDKEYLRYASAKKRLFIGLVMGTSTLVSMFLVLLWIVPYIGLKKIHHTAPWILGVLIFTAIFIVAWAAFGWSSTSFQEKHCPCLNGCGELRSDFSYR